MLAKMTSKNQLTLPKSITTALEATEYFGMEVRNGQIILTPVRIQRGDAVRAKLAEPGLQEQDIDELAASLANATHPAADFPPHRRRPNNVRSGEGLARRRPLDRDQAGSGGGCGRRGAAIHSMQGAQMASAPATSSIAR